MMTLEQQNTELQQRIMELMRENRFLKNEFTAVRSSLGIIKESTDATHQIIVDLEQQNADLLRQNAELMAHIERLRGALESLADKASQVDGWECFPSDYLERAYSALNEKPSDSYAVLKQKWAKELSGNLTVAIEKAKAKMPFG